MWLIILCLVSSANAERMLTMVLKAVASISDAKLIIKTHPADNSDLFDEVDGIDSVILIRDGNAIEAALDAGVAIVSTSTVGFEVCALGKPLVVLSIPGVQIHEAYQEYGSALFAATELELKECIDSIRNNERIVDTLQSGRQALVRDMFADLVPGAPNRISESLAREARCLI